MTSTEISQHVGGELADLFPDVRPDMHHPDLTVHVEMREKYAFVHAGPVPGAGGMPIGSNGRAALLLSGGIDSPVAGWMMAKRGLELCGIHFFSYPYTSERAKEKVLELGRKLTAWCGRMSVMVVPFTHIQEEIRDKCHEELFTLIMRRFYDAYCRARSLLSTAAVRSSPVSRSVRLPGDHARHGRYRRGVRPAGIPSLHRHG